VLLGGVPGSALLLVGSRAVYAGVRWVACGTAWDRGFSEKR
jgi:hypothetical protein